MAGPEKPIPSSSSDQNIFEFKIKAKDIDPPNSPIQNLEIFTRHIDAITERNAGDRVHDGIVSHWEEQIGVLTEALLSDRLSKPVYNKMIAELIADQELQKDTDYLTGAYNRRGLLKRYSESYAHAKRTHDRRNAEPLSIALVDLDHFKRINDTYGHDAGDQVLIQIVVFFKNQLRASDIVGRVGGEEFLLVLPDTNLDQSTRLFNRLQLNINNKVSQAVHEKGFPIAEPITMSAGIAQAIFSDDPRNHSDEARNELISIADSRMYRAKAAGRNRFIISDE